MSGFQTDRQHYSADEVMDADLPIPLETPDPSHGAIIPDQGPSQTTGTVRSRRKDSRKAFDGIWVLFEPDSRTGGTIQVECPLIDISVSGFALIYDKPMKSGIKGYLSYRSMCDKPVRVSFTIKRCIPRPDSRYFIGGQFDKRLNVEDRKPARSRAGRSVVLGVRARRIPADSAAGAAVAIDEELQSRFPHVIHPSPDSGVEIPLSDD